MELLTLPAASQANHALPSQGGMPIGLGIDIGDRRCELCVYSAGVVLEQSRFPTTAEGLREAFSARSRTIPVAIEAGTHSPWISRQLVELGFKVYVANPRKLKAISSSERKNDRNDAKMLAKLVAADPSLLFPVEHRSAERDAALVALKARDALVRVRGRLVTTIRCFVKSDGARLRKCHTAAFVNLESDVPESIRPFTAPMFVALRSLNEQITAYDAQLEALAEHFPEVRYVKQVQGVGTITALAFVLVIGAPKRFPDARTAAAYLGLVPRQDQSGRIDKSLGISKTGNGFLRRLLVQCAHFVMGPNGVDSDLRRWGTAALLRLGKPGKKRIVIAVARKLAVLLFRLWCQEAEWEPLHNANKKPSVSSAAADVDLPNFRTRVTASGALKQEASSLDLVREIAAPQARIPSCTEDNYVLTTSADRSVEPGKARQSVANEVTRPAEEPPRTVPMRTPGTGRVQGPPKPQPRAAARGPARGEGSAEARLSAGDSARVRPKTAELAPNRQLGPDPAVPAGKKRRAM